MAEHFLLDDNTLGDQRDAVEADSGAEPATSHDVAEGGVLGAVGGAVVGAIAAGPLAPIGAVIGAVVGGIASAAAVDAVDKHDHDYAQAEHSSMEHRGNVIASSEPALVGADSAPDLGVNAPLVSVPLMDTFPTTVAPTSAQKTLVPDVAMQQERQMPDLASQIRLRAYKIYEQRGRYDGHAVEDWLQSEREIQHEVQEDFERR